MATKKPSIPSKDRFVEGLFVLTLLDQILVPQLLAIRSIDHQSHLLNRIQSSPIVTALELGNVAVKMGRAHFVVGSVVTPLQK